jgi:hypothetical protein
MEMLVARLCLAPWRLGALAPWRLGAFAACVMAISSAAAKDDAKLVERYAADALGLLMRARQVGFFADAATIDNLRHDADLVALRERDDFHQFLADLDKSGDE